MTELGVANINSLWTSALPMEGQILVAKAAGYDFVEAHPTRIGNAQLHLGILANSLWSHIHSVHQGFRGEQTWSQATSLTKKGAYLTLPYGNDTIGDIDAIAGASGSKRPAVAYPERLEKIPPTDNISEWLVQPTQYVVELAGAHNATDLRDWYIANGLMVCLDMYHIQQLDKLPDADEYDGGSREFIEEAAAAHLISELHVPMERSDFGTSQGVESLDEVLRLTGERLQRVVVEGFVLDPRKIIQSRRHYQSALQRAKLSSF